MQFVSLGFLLLLPLAAFINYLIPRKYRYIWLLVTSIFFYLGIDLKASAVMAGTVVVTYFAALFIERLSENSGKRAVGSRIVFVLAVVIDFLATAHRKAGEIDISHLVGFILHLFGLNGQYTIVATKHDVSVGSSQHRSFMELTDIVVACGGVVRDDIGLGIQS